MTFRKNFSTFGNLKMEFPRLDHKYDKRCLDIEILDEKFSEIDTRLCDVEEDCNRTYSTLESLKGKLEAIDTLKMGLNRPVERPPPERPVQKEVKKPPLNFNPERYTY